MSVDCLVNTQKFILIYQILVIIEGTVKNLKENNTHYQFFVLCSKHICLVFHHFVICASCFNGTAAKRRKIGKNQFEAIPSHCTKLV